LAAASHSERGSVADVEAQVKSLLGSGLPSQEAGVHVSSSELQGFLSQIDGYF
jgi:hypothetical protein